MQLKIQEIMNVQTPFEVVGSPNRPYRNNYYKLLTWFSHQYNNSLFYDIGTHKGHSALCLATNPNNKVITVDIADRKKKHGHRIANVPNIEIWTTDCIKMNSADFNNAELIYLDISHNGTDEIKFLSLLESNNFCGYLIMDDINFPERFPALHDVWNSITYRKEILPVEISHFTGTGLVSYGEDFECV